MNDTNYVDYERQLLISILNSPDILDDILNNPEFNNDCFHNSYNQEVYKWIINRYTDNKKISPVKFHTESSLKSEPLIEHNIPFEIEIKSINDIVEYLIKLKTRRKLIEISKEVYEIAKDPGLTKEQYENKAQEIVLSNINTKTENKGVYNLYTALNMFHKEFWDIQDGKKKLSGLSTGIPTLDYKIGGLPKKHLSVIAAQTSRGKTSLAILLALNIIKSGYKAAIISLEMDAIEIVRKLVALDTHVPTSLYMQKFTDNSGNVLSRKEKIFNAIRKNMSSSMERLHELNFYISDTRGLSPADIKARCRRFQKKMEGLDVVIVDYLQMISHGPGEKKSDRVGQTVLDLRNMAGELDCHVALLSQFNRNVKGRPKMDYMRDSGQIEEIADEIILPYRPNYREDNEGTEEALLIIDKGRTVGTGTVKMMFYPSIQYWRDMALEESEGPIKIIKPKGGFKQ